MSDFNVQEELKKLPNKPGVYLMHDVNDTIIYVGKAVNLNNRVRSYFREKIGRGPKIDRMVSLIDRFEYIITDSELEALVLENNLIKEYRPKYNTMLMDDKTYPYIKVTVNEDYPRILFSRTMKKDKAKYFGPYTNAAAVKDTLELINKLYQLRTCNRTMPKFAGESAVLNENEISLPDAENEASDFIRKETERPQESEADTAETTRETEMKPGKTGQSQITEAKPGNAEQLQITETKPGNAEQSQITEAKPGNAEQLLIPEVKSNTANNRACLNFHIGQCMAPCQGNISKEKYREQLNKAMEFLNGNYGLIQRELKEKMQKASENMEFEEAIKYRDLLESVVAVSQKQKIEDSAQNDKDIIALAQDEKDAVVQVFFVRNGRMTGREHFYMTHIEEETKAAILGSFVKQFYAGTPFIPNEIMLSEEIEDAEMIEEWLSGKKSSRVYLRNPKIGQKEKLVELAAKNAALVLAQDREKIKLEEARTIGAVREIEQLLGLAGVQRMEAFDISNISGFENVGSMVVFEKGKPKRSDYRKFKIRSVAGPDDYACMREVLTRRFEHGLEERRVKDESNTIVKSKVSEDSKNTKFERFPDLILMDGGRGQVNIALDVLKELHLDIPVCGMVKDDHHRTRGLYYNNVELPIDTHSEGFKLITRVQDEAHRFAIEYHRSLRKKDQVRSVLDDIPGIGPKRRRALMRSFSHIDDIRNAGVEELMQKGEMPRNAAESIYAYFHKEGN